MTPPDPTVLLWGSAYVILKWTVGLWALRKVRVWWSASR